MSTSCSTTLSHHQLVGSKEQVDLRAHAACIDEAIRLIQLGARAGLVCQTTGLKKAVVHRLYRQLCGHSSPPGQMPFTDAWYLQNEARLLQTSVVWRLHQQWIKTGRSPAQMLIDVYESYTSLVAEPLLDMTRVAFVPRLVTMGGWHERLCRDCRTVFLIPVVIRRRTCPGCQLYNRFRCRRCRAPLEVHSAGRRRQFCDRCRPRSTS